MGVVTAGVALAVAGCGGSNGTNAARPGGDLAKELVNTTPAPKGNLDNVTWALPGGEPATIDPHKSGTEPSNTVVVNLCDHLLRLEPDWSIKPGLAESADWTDDKTFVIKIRKDASFWDGQPVTAQDVAYSLSRQMDPKTEAVNASVFVNVASIKATGDDEVTVAFKQHDAMFRNSLASVAGAIVEQKFTQRAGKELGSPGGGLMCSGAFELVKWSAGQSIVMKANPKWWGGAPKVAQVEFRFIPDDATLTNALVAGEVDGSYELPQGSLNVLSRAPSGKVYMGPSTSSVSMSPTTDQGPAADPRVRAAIDLAMDKDAFIRNQLRGAGTVQKTLTPKLAWEGDAESSVYETGYEALPSTAQNLEQAKNLIAEAKPADKSMAIAIAAGDRLSLQVATLAQAAGKTLGLALEIKQMQATEFSELFYDESKRQDVDFVITAGYQENPGALIYAPLFAIKGSIFNWSGYDKPDVTKALNDARAATDPKQTAELFVKAQAQFAPDRLQISFANMYSLLFMNKRITGAPASFSWISSPWAAQLGAA